MAALLACESGWPVYRGRWPSAAPLSEANRFDHAELVDLSLLRADAEIDTALRAHSALLSEGRPARRSP